MPCTRMTIPPRSIATGEGHVMQDEAWIDLLNQ
jgi:hypothetical protein